MSSSKVKEEPATKPKTKYTQQTVTTATIKTDGFEQDNPDYPEDFIPTFVKPDFGKDAVIKGFVKDGYLVPSGSMLPLGAAIPEKTVLKYGGYFPAGTSFPQGVLVPLHARLANVLPAESFDQDPANDFQLCLVQ